MTHNKITPFHTHSIPNHTPNSPLYPFSHPISLDPRQSPIPEFVNDPNARLSKKKIPLESILPWWTYIPFYTRALDKAPISAWLRAAPVLFVPSPPASVALSSETAHSHRMARPHVYVRAIRDRFREGCSATESEKERMRVANVRTHPRRTCHFFFRTREGLGSIRYPDSDEWEWNCQVGARGLCVCFADHWGLKESVPRLRQILYD